MLRHPSPPAGNGSTSEEEVTLEALELRIEELETELERERKRFRAEMRKGQDAIDRLRDGDATATSLAPTHTHDDGYDVVSKQRVALFVDVQNMYYAARNHYNSKLEFSKLLQHLARGRDLCRAQAYIVERPGMDQAKFIEVLRRNGYEVHKKVLIERTDGSQRGDWDMGIALDAVAISDRVDSVILVTGDGDFTTLCHHLRARGVRVEIASFPESTAAELVKACEHFHKLDERVLLPGAQFQNRSDTERGGRGGSRGGDERAEVRDDDVTEARDDDADDEREADDSPAPPRGRKRARGPLDDDFEEDEFGV